MGGVYSIYGRDVTFITTVDEEHNGRGHLGDMGINWRLMLKGYVHVGWIYMNRDKFQ